MTDNIRTNKINLSDTLEALACLPVNLIDVIDELDEDEPIVAKTENKYPEVSEIDEKLAGMRRHLQAILMDQERTLQEMNDASLSRRTRGLPEQKREASRQLSCERSECDNEVVLKLILTQLTDINVTLKQIQQHLKH